MMSSGAFSLVNPSSAEEMTFVCRIVGKCDKLRKRFEKHMHENCSTLGKIFAKSDMNVVENSQEWNKMSIVLRQLLSHN